MGAGSEPAPLPLPRAHILCVRLKAQERTPLPWSAENAKACGKGIWGRGGRAVPAQTACPLCSQMLVPTGRPCSQPSTPAPEPTVAFVTGSHSV